uniref:Uncharacterized protein n=1 Tax=Cannabis sativa TaxID=3483 RepID=A0A803Q7Q4_CANSA
MDVIRKTPATTATSSGFPQDTMIVNPDVHVPATTRISTNPMDVANPVNSTGTTNLTNKPCQVDTANPVSPNDQTLPPTVDLPLAPPTEGLANMQRPLGTTTDSSPYQTLATSDLASQPGIFGTTTPPLGQPLASQPLSGAPLVGNRVSFLPGTFGSKSSKGQLPYPRLADQSQMSGLGLASLEHILSQGMVSQVLANLRLQPNREGPIDQAPIASDPSMQAQLDQIRDMIKGLDGPKPSNLELDRSTGSPFPAYINALLLPKIKMPS